MWTLFHTFSPADSAAFTARDIRFDHSRYLLRQLVDRTAADAVDRWRTDDERIEDRRRRLRGRYDGFVDGTMRCGMRYREDPFNIEIGQDVFAAVFAARVVSDNGSARRLMSMRRPCRLGALSKPAMIACAEGT